MDQTCSFANDQEAEVVTAPGLGSVETREASKPRLEQPVGGQRTTSRSMPGEDSGTIMGPAIATWKDNRLGSSAWGDALFCCDFSIW
jgi:hypothetical protein